MWPNDRFIKLCGIELPIIQAPNARSALSDMIVAVSQAGGLGRLQADALLESIGDLTLVEDWLGNRKLFESRAVCQKKCERSGLNQPSSTHCQAARASPRVDPFHPIVRRCPRYEIV